MKPTTNRGNQMMDSDFLYLVEAELANEREENSEPIRTAHEIYGIICARSARLLNEIDAPSIDATSAMLRQLVRIAAMCHRAAEDLQLLEVRPEEDRPGIEGIEIETNFQREARYR